MWINNDISHTVAEYLGEFAPAIAKGSLGFLSTIKPQLLLPMVSQHEHTLAEFGSDANRYYTEYPSLKNAKDEFFKYTLQRIRNGNLELILQLAKGVATRDQLLIYLELLSAHSSDLLAIKLRKLLVYPGSFDPMHLGHRTMIASLIKNMGKDINVAVNINSYQASKPYLYESYEQRFAHLEYKILKSTILDPYRVCGMDFRFGAKEGEDHMRQTRMQTLIAGDSRLRWVIGGDKFLSEVTRGQEEEAMGKVGRTLSRFNHKRMSIYIVPRKGQNLKQLHAYAGAHNIKYAADFVLIEELPYEGQTISSSLIKRYYRSEDALLRIEAQRMESIDINGGYHGDHKAK